MLLGPVVVHNEQSSRLGVRASCPAGLSWHPVRSLWRRAYGRPVEGPKPADGQGGALALDRLPKRLAQPVQAGLARPAAVNRETASHPSTYYLSAMVWLLRRS